MASLVGSQYYWIFHTHPVALLGYIAVLEGNPAPIEFLNEVVERTGLPRAAFGSMFKHAALDLQHRNDLDEVLWPEDEPDVPPREGSGSWPAL